MSQAADTLRRLRVAIGGCAALIAVAAALGVLAWDRLQDLDRLAEDERRARLRNSAAVDEMRAQADRLRRFAARHEALERRGLGAFSAPHEVDRLERIAHALALPDGPAIDSYAVRARVPLPESIHTGMTRHHVSTQPLEFESTLPHEDAFAQLWATLSQGLSGLNGIEACALELAGAWPVSHDAAPEGARDGFAPPRLKARCTVRWYVLEARPEGAGPGASGPGAPAGAPSAAALAPDALREPSVHRDPPVLLARAAPLSAGRLFFTPDERARIDASLRAPATTPAQDATAADAAAAADPPPPGPLRVDGVIRDPDGVATVWIDGARIAPGAELRATVAADGVSVRVRRADEAERVLRPGQSSAGPELGPGNRIEIAR
jgi:hypothetical protein